MKAVRLEDVPVALGRPEIRPWNVWAQEVDRLHPHSVLEITDEIETININRFRGGNIRTARKHGLQILKRGKQIFLAKMALDLKVGRNSDPKEGERIDLLEDGS